MNRDTFKWQYVDLPQQEIDEVTSKFREAIPRVVGKQFFQEMNLGITYFCGFKVTQTVLIQAAPTYNGVIHTDIRYFNNRLALNIPLENCETSITTLWESTVPALTWVNSVGRPFNHHPPWTCKKIDEYTLIKPVLFDTTILHSVSNTTTNWRLAMSLRFEKDPWELVGL